MHEIQPIRPIVFAYMLIEAKYAPRFKNWPKPIYWPRDMESLNRSFFNISDFCLNVLYAYLKLIHVNFHKKSKNFIFDKSAQQHHNMP